MRTCLSFPSYYVAHFRSTHLPSTRPTFGVKNLSHPKRSFIQDSRLLAITTFSFHKMDPPEVSSSLATTDLQQIENLLSKNSSDFCCFVTRCVALRTATPIDGRAFLLLHGSLPGTSRCDFAATIFHGRTEWCFGTIKM